MNTHPVDQYLRTLTRRQLFQRVGLGVGGFALANLLNNDLSAATQNPFSHFAPKAKNVIYFHLVGAPSHLDLFDYKPELQKRNGELCPKEMFEGKQLAFIRSRPSLSVHPRIQDTNLKNVENPVSGFPICSPIFRPWQMICASSAPAYRAVQSCTCPDVYADGVRAVWSTEPRSVDKLWDRITQ